jgi:hypothetical protein
VRDFSSPSRMAAASFTFDKPSGLSYSALNNVIWPAVWVSG